MIPFGLLTNDQDNPDLPSPAPMQMVRVINHNDFPIKDRYDGVPYIFETNIAKDISPAAASHFFGWPGEREDRNFHIIRRLGWNSIAYLEAQPDRRTKAEILCDNIEIQTITYDIVPRLLDAVPANAGIPIPSDPEEAPVIDGTMLPAPIAASDASGTAVGKRRGWPKGKPRKPRVIASEPAV